jgi:outer membrane lipoprotein-sorting protein
MNKITMLLALLLTACATTQGPTVDDIVASNIAARGGAERIRSLRSIRETGTVTGPGGKVAQIVREIKRPGLFRLEFTFQGTTSVFANDGKNGWQIAPLQGQFSPMAMRPDADAAGGADQQDIEGPLVDWKAKGHTVTLLGREMVDGKDAYKLKVEMRGDGVRYDYVDVASHQVVRADVTRIIQGHPTVLQTTFSDFRPTDGLVFPHVIETHAKDRPQVLRIVVDSIELNPDIDDARFRMPK